VNLQVGDLGSMYVEQFAPLDGDGSWGLSDTYALGRGLSNSLAVGQWTLLARHGSDVNSFCGFNLRTSTSTESFKTDEILRFGINYDEGANAMRVCFSTNADADYAYLDLGDDDVRDADLEYSIAWSTVAGSFTLGVGNGKDYVEVTADLPSGSPVAMLGAGIFEMNLDDKDDLTFDDYGISVIPEPGAAGTVVLGAWLLQRLFRSRIRRTSRHVLQV